MSHASRVRLHEAFAKTTTVDEEHDTWTMHALVDSASLCVHTLFHTAADILLKCDFQGLMVGKVDGASCGVASLTLRVTVRHCA